MNRELSELRFRLGDRSLLYHEELPTRSSGGAGEALCSQEDDDFGKLGALECELFYPSSGHVVCGDSNRIDIDELKHFRCTAEEYSGSPREYARHSDGPSQGAATSPYRLSPEKLEGVYKITKDESDNMNVPRQNALEPLRSNPSVAMSRGVPKGLSLSDSELDNRCKRSLELEPHNDTVIDRMSAIHGDLPESDQYALPLEEGPTKSCDGVKGRRHRISRAHLSRGFECSSYSESDDEAVRILARQLKRKGEVVHFRPPRRCVETKTYSHFGVRERQAIAQFEYLRDISTDVSGLMSSPDHNTKQL